MRRTVINAKGQVTIPAGLREKFGIEKGACIDWTEMQGRLVLTPINRLRLDMRFLKASRKSTSALGATLPERRRGRHRQKN